MRIKTMTSITISKDVYDKLISDQILLNKWRKLRNENTKRYKKKRKLAVNKGE